MKGDFILHQNQYWKVLVSMLINIFLDKFLCFDIVFITQNNFHLDGIFSY